MFDRNICPVTLHVKRTNSVLALRLVHSLNGSGKTTFPCFPLLKPGISEGSSRDHPRRKQLILTSLLQDLL
ncbi:ARHGEF3 isoform 7 [Pan troglodytes]|uniref:ARHGEF3 isoform 7 n=1 Tax=Pan troglodytes TaxID=9598 RepID=A0A2J8P7W2_PANTR|nr:ARHGEF3 isoform 7 [Pan troglodytes]